MKAFIPKSPFIVCTLYSFGFSLIVYGLFFLSRVFVVNFVL